MASGPSEPIRLSVIIPARNANATLGDCLEALAMEGLPASDAEVLVVDDASTDDTAAIARRHNATVLPGTGGGPAGARNVGALASRGRLLIFLDADTAPNPGWLAELLRPFEDSSVVAVKGAYTTNQRALMARFTQLEFEHKYARLAKATRVDFVDTGTAAYRREAFLAVDGFDEKFVAEDIELAFRLAEQGSRLVFVPQARVRHQHADRLSVYLYKKFRYGFYRTAVYQRHPSKVLGDSYTPPLMGVQILMAGLIWLLALPALANFWHARRALSILALAYCATTSPLAARAVRSDPPLAPLVPVLVLSRSTAQGVGLATGLAASALRRLGLIS